MWGGGSKPCAACGKSKSKSEYEKDEYKKPTATRTCIECQKTGTPTSAAPARPKFSVGSRGAPKTPVTKPETPGLHGSSSISARFGVFGRKAEDTEKSEKSEDQMGSSESKKVIPSKKKIRRKVKGHKKDKEGSADADSETLSGGFDKKSGSHSETDQASMTSEQLTETSVTEKSEQLTETSVIEKSEQLTETKEEQPVSSEAGADAQTTVTTNTAITPVTAAPFRYSELSRKKSRDVSSQMLYYYSFLQRHLQLENTKLKLEQKKRKAETDEYPPVSEDQPPRKVTKKEENQAPHVPYFSSLTLDDLLEREREHNSQSARLALGSDVQPQQVRLYRALSLANELYEKASGEGKTSTEGGDVEPESQPANKDSEEASEQPQQEEKSEVTEKRSAEEVRGSEVAQPKTEEPEIFKEVNGKEAGEPKAEESVETREPEESVEAKPTDVPKPVEEKVYEEVTLSVNGPYLRRNVSSPHFPGGGYKLGSDGYGMDAPVGYSAYYGALGQARYTAPIAKDAKPPPALAPVPHDVSSPVQSSPQEKNLPDVQIPLPASLVCEIEEEEVSVNLRLPERPMPARLGPSAPERNRQDRESNSTSAPTKAEHKHKHHNKKSSTEAKSLVTRSSQLSGKGSSKENKDDGKKRKGKSREELQQERDKRQADRQKRHKKEKKAAAKIAKGEPIIETLAMPTIPFAHEITETLSLNLPEIMSITIDQSEPQNIIRLSPELVTAANLDVAVKLVEQKARAQQPQDDRVVGQVDMIKAALSVLSFTEQVPAIKEVLKKWLYKLQLSWARLIWDWKVAYRFKTKDKIEEVYVSEELKSELSKMMLTVEVEKTPAAPDQLQEGFGTRLTRANSNGLNRKLDFNYFNTPLPLERGLLVPEDRLWDPLDEEELWHQQIYPGAPIVIDSGSRFVKVGEAGNEIPRYVIPSLVASSRQKQGQYLAGFEALRKATDPRKWNIQPVFDPMEPDWDSGLSLWEHIFQNLLQVDTSEHPIMMTETPDMSVNGREETMEIMFEYFNVPSLYIGNSALMSLYAIGEAYIGNRLQIIPVNAGVIEQHAAVQLKRGVTNINKYLSDLLEEKGHYFQTAKEREEVRVIKEKCCYVASNYERELARPESDIIIPYTRESGEVISIGRERFKCPELLFNPAKLGILDASFALPQLITETIMKCDIDTRVNLLSNIMLVGGGTLIPGMGDRIEDEVYNSLVSDYNMRAARRSNIRCISAPNRKYLPWKGASIFATTEGWEDRCQTIDDYFELGKEFLAEKTMYS